jgi:hypothetical protein
MEENMMTQNIIKWLKKKKVNKNFGYYVDEELFIIKFPFEYEDQVMSILKKALEGVPYMMSYSVWDDVKIHIHLNHPKLKPEKIYELLPALESAEKIIN